MTITPNTPSETEAWLESLGSKFADVRLYVRNGGNMEWVDERHIDDPETLQTTVSMTLDRLGGRFAVWLCPERHWMLYDRRNNALCCYPSQEAAEMVAMHSRG